MRHRVAHRKLGRVTEHRIAMLRNQATALLRHEPSRRRCRRRRSCGRSSSGSSRSPSAGSPAATPTADRCTRGGWSCATCRTARSSRKLFDTLAPRFAARPGGYTRLLRLGLPPRRQRRGRAGRAGRQRVQPERRGREGRGDREAAEAEEGARPVLPRKSQGGERRVRRGDDRDQEGQAARPKGKGGKADTRGKGVKTSSPRKAGGA